MLPPLKKTTKAKRTASGRSLLSKSDHERVARELEHMARVREDVEATSANLRLG